MSIAVDKDTLEKIADRAHAVAPADTERKATVVLRQGRIPEAADAVANVLREHIEGLGVYARDKELVRMAYLPVDGFRDRNTGKPQQVRTLAMLPITQTNFELAISRIVEFVRHQRTRGKGGQKGRLSSRRSDCPPKIAKALLEGPEHWDGWPRVERVAQTPLLLVDSGRPRLITKNGRHGSTFLDVSSVIADMMLPSPLDLATARGALARLKEWIEEFPFENDLSRDVALAGMMTAAMRASIVEAPMFFISKPSYGAGATTLAKLFSILATGVEPPVVAASRSDQEFRKQLDALLLKGSSVIVLDNLRDGETLSSAVLAQALSERLVETRVLGVSRMITCDTRRLFLATAVNGTIDAELARRTMPLRIDPKQQNPEARAFRRPHLLHEAASARAQILRDVYTVVAAYWSLPEGERVRTMGLGTYNEWLRAVAEPLLWLGGSDVVEATREAGAQDPTNERLKELLPALLLMMELKGRQGLTVSEMIVTDGEPVAFTDDAGLLRDQITRVFAAATRSTKEFHGQPQVNALHAAKWLQAVKQRVIECRRIEMTPAAEQAEQAKQGRTSPIFRETERAVRARIIKCPGSLHGSALWGVEVMP